MVGSAFAPLAHSGFVCASALRRLFAILAVITAVGCGSDSGPMDPPDNPSPTVSGVAPATVVAGSDAFVITVSGSGFVESSTVRWNGTARTTTYLSATQLTAAISAGDIASEGTAAITVFNPAPGGGQSQSSTMTITPAPVTTVTLSEIDGPLVPQQTFTLEATPRSENGAPLSGRSITWSSTNEGVASVTQSGLVLAVGLGQAEIRATSEGIVGTKQVTVVPGGVVGPEGGSVALAGNTVTLEFPAGAVAAPVGITIVADPTPPADANLISGSGYILGPNGANFAQPVVVRIRYDAGSLPPGTNPNAFLVHRWNGTEWVPLGNPSVDTGVGSVSGTTTSFSPFAILEVTPVLQSIEAGGNHSCAVVVGGATFCWGWGGQGALGDGLSQNSLLPVQVAGGHNLQYVTTGFDHNCALRTDSTALCWGAGDSGQIGRGVVGDVSTPHVVAGGAFDLVSAGFDHNCGLRENGSAWCWGAGETGGYGLGNGDSPPQATPVAVSGGHIFESIDAGGYHSCGVKEDGSAWCWGFNQDGQVGDGSFEDRMTPVQVLGGHEFVELAAGGYHTCGRKADGSVFCWGWNSSGQVGNGSAGSDVATPLLVEGGLQFTSISAGSQHSCGVTVSGAGYCWGNGQVGRLGTGNAESSSGPALILGGHEFAHVSAGDWNTCGRTVEGEGYCWGWGTGSGNGSSSTVFVPTPIALPVAPIAQSGAAQAGAATVIRALPSKQQGQVGEQRGRD